jgi:hypothetical protein
MARTSFRVTPGNERREQINEHPALYFRGLAREQRLNLRDDCLDTPRVSFAAVAHRRLILRSMSCTPGP